MYYIPYLFIFWIKKLDYGITILANVYPQYVRFYKNLVFLILGVLFIKINKL